MLRKKNKILKCPTLFFISPDVSVSVIPPSTLGQSSKEQNSSTNFDGIIAQ